MTKVLRLISRRKWLICDHYTTGGNATKRYVEVVKYKIYRASYQYVVWKHGNGGGHISFLFGIE